MGSFPPKPFEKRWGLQHYMASFYVHRDAQLSFCSEFDWMHLNLWPIQYGTMPGADIIICLALKAQVSVIWTGWSYMDYLTWECQWSMCTFRQVPDHKRVWLAEQHESRMAPWNICTFAQLYCTSVISWLRHEAISRTGRLYHLHKYKEAGLVLLQVLPWWHSILASRTTVHSARPPQPSIVKQDQKGW